MNVEPAEYKAVKGEWLCLLHKRQLAQSYVTRRKGLLIKPEVGPPAAIAPNSVVVREGTRQLVKDKDYLMDTISGTLCLGPTPSVSTNCEVEVDYQFSLRRIDSRIRTHDGRVIIRKGKSHLTSPLPPKLNPGEQRLANIFIDYHSNGKHPDVYPLKETSDSAQTLTVAERIPKTMAMLRSGEATKIVCWGDSVTTGGDASSPSTRYTTVFEQRLKRRFSEADIDVEVIAVGGSNSRQWLNPEKYPGNPGCNWQRIEDAAPDLVTIEFVNDSGFEPLVLNHLYADILSRLHRIGTEVILITPHFTMQSMMGFKTLRDKESRPYVFFLRGLASTNKLALADASSRWEHLWKEGLPYVTLLGNGINHPDDHGHAIFADELMKCFETAQE